MRRTEIKKRPLADTVLASLEPEDKEYREQDGSGLYFRVKPNGQKGWLFRFKKADGAWSWHGLGGYPEIPAKIAREKARAMRDLVSSGVNPVEHKAGIRKAKETSLTNPFREAAEHWLNRKAEGGLAESTLYIMRGYLDKDVLPAIGDIPIAEVTRKHCADIQASIESRGASNTRDKVRVALRQIFSQAIARGLCDNNPASELLSISSKTPRATPYPHLLEAELPAFLKALRMSTSRGPAKTATWLCLWTASRPGMVRWAEWVEIDLDRGLWTIPADKMKMRRDHVVPLPRQAIEALRDLHRLTGQGRYVFPGIGATHPVISENTINLTLCKIGYRARLVGHGTRHTASTLLREHGWHKDHIEAQLAHKESGVSGIYNQASYLAQRRALVQWYADYLDALADGITPLQRAEFARRVNVVNPA